MVIGGKEVSTKLVAGIGGGLVAAGIAAGVILSIGGQQSYRSIAAVDTIGTCIVRRNADEMDAFVGMKFESGDDVRVGDASELDLVLDQDKYVCAEQNTHLWMEAAGDENASSTVIYMDEGASLHRIENKLSGESSYVVETPTSTMSIRGTIVRMAVEKDPATGLSYSLVQLYEGAADVQLKTTEGELVGEPVQIQQGFQCLIRGDETFSEIVIQKYNGEPEEQIPIDYTDAPQSVITHIKEEQAIGREVFSGDVVMTEEDIERVEEEIKEKEANGITRFDSLFIAINNEFIFPEDEEEELPVVEEELEKEEEAEAIPVEEPTPTPTKKVVAPVVEEPEVTPTPEASPAVAAASDDEEDSDDDSEPETPAAKRTIQYLYNGQVFASTVVDADSQWMRPVFQPEAEGDWEMVSDTATLVTYEWK